MRLKIKLNGKKAPGHKQRQCQTHVDMHITDKLTGCMKLPPSTCSFKIQNFYPVLVHIDRKLSEIFLKQLTWYYWVFCAFLYCAYMS